MEVIYQVISACMWGPGTPIIIAGLVWLIWKDIKEGRNQK